MKRAKRTKRANKRVKKNKTHRIKTVKLTPQTALRIDVPKGAAPTFIADPIAGSLHIVPVPAANLKDKTWFERWFGS